MTSRPYPLYVHRTVKVDSILYQKFALWTYTPFRHEISLLYLSWNILLRVLAYVCRHVISNVFNLNKHFFLFLFLSAHSVAVQQHERLTYVTINDVSACSVAVQQHERLTYVTITDVSAYSVAVQQHERLTWL